MQDTNIQKRDKFSINDGLVQLFQDTRLVFHDLGKGRMLRQDKQREQPYHGIKVLDGTVDGVV